MIALDHRGLVKGHERTLTVVFELSPITMDKHGASSALFSCSDDWSPRNHRYRIKRGLCLQDRRA